MSSSRKSPPIGQPWNHIKLVTVCDPITCFMDFQKMYMWERLKEIEAMNLRENKGGGRQGFEGGKRKGQ